MLTHQHSDLSRLEAHTQCAPLRVGTLPWTDDALVAGAHLPAADDHAGDLLLPGQSEAHCHCTETQPMPQSHRLQTGCAHQRCQVIGPCVSKPKVEPEMQMQVPVHIDPILKEGCKDTGDL